MYGREWINKPRARDLYLASCSIAASSHCSSFYTFIVSNFCDY